MSLDARSTFPNGGGRGGSCWHGDGPSIFSLGYPKFYLLYLPPSTLPPSLPPIPSYLLVHFLMTNRFHGDHRGRSDSGDGDGDLAIQTVGYQEIDEKTNFRIAAEIDLCTRESLHEVRGRGEEGQRRRGGGRGEEGGEAGGEARRERREKENND